VEVKNPRNMKTVVNEYDEKGRTVLQNFPDNSSMSFEYKEETKEVILTERNGRQVTYVHDELFRDIKHIHSDGTERYQYNKRNQKTLIVDKLRNKTQYAYDDKGSVKV